MQLARQPVTFFGSRQCICLGSRIDQTGMRVLQVTIKTLVLLLMRPKSKGIGFLIGFVIVQILTTSGWYIRFFLGQAEMLRSNQWFAFALNLALTILHTGGTVLFLAFILASWTKSNVAMGTPPRL